MAENGHVELESSRGHAHACPRPVSWPLRSLRPIYGDIYLFRTFARTILYPAPLWNSENIERNHNPTAVFLLLAKLGKDIGEPGETVIRCFISDV